MTRGEVWWAELAPRSSSEQQGRRPVLVVSHDAFNTAAAWRSVTVVPLSTAFGQRRRGPTAIALDRGDGGLPAESVALCRQITTLDRGKLVERVGAPGAPALAAIRAGIEAALDLR